MKIDGIKGDVTAKGHEGWIDLSSCQLGVHRSVTSPSGRGANREATVPSVNEIVITKDLDSASTALFRASLWGEGKKVIIDFVGSDGVPYLTIELTNALIANYNVSGHGGSAQSSPMESLSINFTNIEYKTKTQPKDPKQASNLMEWRFAVDRIA